MKRSLIIAILLLSALAIEAQTAVGQWTDCLPYNTAVCLAVGTDEVYASTGWSILIYNRSFDELKKLSRINGLSETGISSIGWSQVYKTLIIAYNSTNVDLMVNNTIYNIPDILRKYIEGGKTVNRIRTHDKYAYLACSFGIVVIDLVKKEIYDTWKPGLNSDVNAINDIAFSDNKIFAATDNGVYSAGLEDQGLSYFGNWSRMEILPVPSGKYTAAVYSGNRLYVNLSDPSSGGDKVYSADFSSSLISFTPGIYNYSFDNSTTGFTVSSGGMLRYFNTAGQLTGSVTSYSWGNPMIVMAVEENGTTWIADSRSGLVRSGNRTDFTSLSLPGPASTNAFYISSLNGTTAITGGGTDQAWNNTGRQLEISINRNNEWNNIVNSSLLDPVRVIIDPKDNNHVFVSTWGSGLLEYLNNSLVKQYNDSNSPLQSIVPGHPYVRIAGMAFDRSGKLWITQSGVQGSIKILKPDGTWITNPLTADAPVIGDLIITLKGQVWVILPEGHGLFVFDDNNTPDITSDDRYRKIQVKDNDNQTISSVYSIAEDLDGNIWVGTDQGPVIYYSSVDVFNTDPKASRIKIPRNDGSDLADYLLKTETITAISVDGGNRKWLGTSGSGAYLLYPDGMTIQKNFNTRNSPLFSNSITSLAVDNITGDVWFATSAGVLSYRGNATQGGEKFSKVYAFPNPVRENFTGNVTITGLIRNTQIRITDISGNLVYKTVSEGGEASWDLKIYNGKRVATGVYLVFCSSEDGSQAIVTKMLIIK